jgi:hypothetical protein
VPSWSWRPKKVTAAFRLHSANCASGAVILAGLEVQLVEKENPTQEARFARIRGIIRELNLWDTMEQGEGG